MDKLLTISVAAYNVEKYLDKLMQSVIDSDTLDKIEVLIVNDGSKDDTARIAHSYEDKYPDSVRLIDKENGGHGSTINKGIEEACGKYFRALDGDDWVHSGHLHTLVDKLPEIESDIILCDYCECYETGEEKIIEFEGVQKDKLYQFDELQETVKWMRYHNVIYRTEILKTHNIRLSEHCFYVDREFMLFPIPFVSTVYYAKDYIYCYRLGLNEQSVSSKSRMKNAGHSLKVSQRILQYYKEYESSISKEKKNYFIYGITDHCFWHFNTLMLFPYSRQKKEEIASFDRLIKSYSIDVYKGLEKRSKKVKALRITNYHAYRAIRSYLQLKHK